ncbi:Protein of unknown function [Gryllus bimaculatus]|nr:Protein of unknown function [Gryllus bimaculatus]
MTNTMQPQVHTMQPQATGRIIHNCIQVFHAREISARNLGRKDQLECKAAQLKTTVALKYKIKQNFIFTTFSSYNERMRK